MMGVKMRQFQCFRSFFFFFFFFSDNRKRMVADAMSPPSVQEENWLEKATKPAATYTNKATKC